MSRGPSSLRLLVAAASLASCAPVRPPPAPGPGPGEGWTRRAFAVREHGRLLLTLPPGWSAMVGETGEAGMPAIRLEGPDGAFAVELTPLWNPGESEGDEARVDSAQLFAEIARRRALAGSVEREIPLEQLSGPGVKGFWFAATDRELLGRAPDPGEWRNILQGAAAVGPVLLSFALLDNGPGPQRGQVLEIVRSARHAGDGEGEAGEREPEVEPIPSGRTVPLRVGWPGKRWAVLVDLPGFSAGARKGGGWRGPFVIGVHPVTGIVASVSLLPAGAATDAGGCRDEAVAAIASALSAAVDVRGPEVARPGGPGAVRATYTLAGTDDGVVQRHVHGFLHRDGLCVNVHVSKADPEQGDWERIEEILATIRFGEDL